MRPTAKKHEARLARRGRQQRRLGHFGESTTLRYDTGGQTSVKSTVVSQTMGQRNFDLLASLPEKKIRFLVKVAFI